MCEHCGSMDIWQSDGLCRKCGKFQPKHEDDNQPTPVAGPADVSYIREYGLNQKLSNQIRVY